MSTRSLLAVVLLKPRAPMAHWRESTCATCKLVARRRISGRLDAPERRMSSCVITWIAEAVCDSCSGRLETEVTCRFISCSMLSFFKASAEESGCWANAVPAKQTRLNVKSVELEASFPHKVAFLPGEVVTHVTRPDGGQLAMGNRDRKSTRLNSSHPSISYAVFCLKK